MLILAVLAVLLAYKQGRRTALVTISGEVAEQAAQGENATETLTVSDEDLIVCGTTG